MRTAIALLALAALTAVSSGCAQKRWARAGADGATISRDLDDCRGDALLRAHPRGPGAPSRGAQVVDRGASPVGGRVAGTSNDRFIAEHEDVRRCMATRGYRLEPAS